MKVRLIHGIHAIEGDSNMAHFAPHLARALPEAQVELFEYGFLGFWVARVANHGIASDFAIESALGQRRRQTEVWITHSNGAAIAWLAVERYGALPDLIININPALDRWRTARVEQVETIHSDGDRAVWWSQWLPGHLWGDQGKVGYRGRMGNTINHNASRFGHGMRYEGHMGAFSPVRIKRWAEFCAGRIRQFKTGVET